MARPGSSEDMHVGFGLLIVDKPVGPTSHSVVNIVRRGTGVRKVGHAGTLDPRASGVLVLCLGAATRLSEYLSSNRKCYEGVVRFGQATDTYDADGQVVLDTGRTPALEDIQACLGEFEGEQVQVPPAYSAIKLQGRRAYEMARAGEEVELEPRPVTIYSIRVLAYEPPDLAIEVDCSAGTYIRSLAQDLGARLETGAHLVALRRTRSGRFGLEQAVRLADLESAFKLGTWEDYMLPAAEALPELPVVQVGADELDLVRNGRPLPATSAEGMARALDPQGNLVAILEAAPGADNWQPRKVFIN
jgi:tRNA pseudouridine55 synthase